MTTPRKFYASLQINGTAGTSAETFLRGIADVLARHDGGRDEVRISTRHAGVASETMIVKVVCDRDPMRGTRIGFHLAARPGREAPTKTRAVSVLSDIVVRALPLVEARHVEWLQPGVALTPEEFLAAQSYISPRRARREIATLPDADTSFDIIDRNLAQMLDSEKSLFEAAPSPAPEAAGTGDGSAAPDTGATAPANVDAEPAEAAPGTDAEEDAITPLRARAASWSLTAALSVISLPVALVLAAVHAVRGADMRLSIHVLALTGTGSVLMRSGLFDPLLHLVSH